VSNKPIVLILLHNDSVEANKIAAQVCQQLNKAQVSICALASDKKLVQTQGFEIDEFIEGKSANPNLALVFGGDGTILRAVEVTRKSNIPVLGINLGHVGFLADAENKKALELETEATSVYLDVTVNFLRKMLPYTDKGQIVTMILFYEQTLKDLHGLEAQ